MGCGALPDGPSQLGARAAIAPAVLHLAQVLAQNLAWLGWMRVFACRIRVGVRARLGLRLGLGLGYGLGFVQSLARGALGHCLDKLDMCKVLVGGGALRNVRLDLVGL